MFKLLSGDYNSVCRNGTTANATGMDPGTIYSVWKDEDAGDTVYRCFSDSRSSFGRYHSDGDKCSCGRNSRSGTRSIKGTRRATGIA